MSLFHRLVVLGVREIFMMKLKIRAEVQARKTAKELAPAIQTDLFFDKSDINAESVVKEPGKERLSQLHP